MENHKIHIRYLFVCLFVWDVVFSMISWFCFVPVCHGWLRPIKCSSINGSSCGTEHIRVNFDSKNRHFFRYYFIFLMKHTEKTHRIWLNEWNESPSLPDTNGKKSLNNKKHNDSRIVANRMAMRTNQRKKMRPPENKHGAMSIASFR